MSIRILSYVLSYPFLHNFYIFSAFLYPALYNVTSYLSIKKNVVVHKTCPNYILHCTPALFLLFKLEVKPLFRTGEIDQLLVLFTVWKQEPCIHTVFYTVTYYAPVKNVETVINMFNIFIC